MKNLKPIGDAAKKCFQAGKKFLDECTEAENIVAANRAAAMQMAQMQADIASYQSDYDRVADALCRFLVSNSDRCGLAYPRQIEDVRCAATNVSIVPLGLGIATFVFEVDRITSPNMFIGGMRKLERPTVETQRIEKELNSKMPIFLRDWKYHFEAPIQVVEIADNRVRIEIPCIWREEIVI